MTAISTPSGLPEVHRGTRSYFLGVKIYREYASSWRFFLSRVFRILFPHKRREPAGPRYAPENIKILKLLFLDP